MPHDLRAEPRSLLYEATGRWKNASDRLRSGFRSYCITGMSEEVSAGFGLQSSNELTDATA